MDYYGNNDWRDYLAHYGVSKAAGAKVGSGRYPLGSGKNPRQGSIKYYTAKNSGSSFPRQVSYTKLNSNSDRDFPLRAVYTNPDGSLPKEFPTSAYANANGFLNLLRRKKKEEPIKRKPIPGLKLKTREYTLKEDVAAVNPKNGEMNCMLCTTAFELRRRGYDVSAKVSVDGFPTEALLSWYKDIDINVTHRLNSWDDYFKNAQAASSPRGNVSLEKAVMKDLKKQGVGARGNLMVRLSLYAGHSVAYEVTEKGVQIYDTQQNQIYTVDESKKIMRRVLGAEYARTDTAEFNESMAPHLVDNRLTDTSEDYKKPGHRFNI